jgi:hypothetical protein
MVIFRDSLPLVVFSTTTSRDMIFSSVVIVRLTRIGTWGTTPHGLGRPKEEFAITRPTIQKIPEDYSVLPKA